MSVQPCQRMHAQCTLTFSTVPGLVLAKPVHPKASPLRTHGELAGPLQNQPLRHLLHPPFANACRQIYSDQSYNPLHRSRTLLLLSDVVNHSWCPGTRICYRDRCRISGCDSSMVLLRRRCTNKETTWKASSFPGRGQRYMSAVAPNFLTDPAARVWPAPAFCRHLELPAPGV